MDFFRGGGGIKWWAHPLQEEFIFQLWMFKWFKMNVFLSNILVYKNIILGLFIVENCCLYGWAVGPWT